VALSNQEKLRYSRHLNLPDFGIPTQEKLKRAKVLVVGTGGLGAPLLQYLTAVGVGTIGVVDFDVIDESNLQRQVLFGMEDIGKFKTKVAITKLRAQNPFVHFIEYNLKLDASNALEIISNYDVVADGTDNFPTRYLVNDACVLTGKPNVYASIYRFEGQVSVFNWANKEGILGPNYRDVFPTPPPPGMVPNCAEGGVLGVLPGIIGSIQASEVIKVITGMGVSLSGKLFLMDVLDFSNRTLNIKRDPKNPLNGETPTINALIDYESFCGITNDSNDLIDLSPIELARWRREGQDFQLIDVREAYEFEAGNIGGQGIPLGELAASVNLIDKNRPVVFLCKSGKRSAQAIENITSLAPGYSNLRHLKGGLLSWKEQVDADLLLI
jgi:molybdopterin/thiamine biosynthesis adenylyltransferase/rhodanese-related sulfurtransferase|tara:strand:- start:91 stop:1239 length:1149 start_codon:yes stop_codon:yes gene_type:complete